MGKGILLAIVWLTAFRAFPQTRLETEALLESPGALTVRARCAGDGFLAFLAASGSTGGIPEQWTAGLACPWLVAGPLEAAGLLLVASSPMAYAAGSAAWRQRTDLEARCTLTPARIGVAAFPLPDALCLYCFQAGDGTEAGPREAGAFLSLPLGLAALGETVVSVSVPDVPGAEETWYVTRSRWTGGVLGRAACRALFLPPSATAALAAGASFGGPGAPGGFAQAAGAYQGEGASAALLLACCGRDYMALDGFGPTDLLRVSAEAALGDARTARLSASWLFRMEQPGPVPAAFLATKGRGSLEFRRVFPLGPCGLVFRGGADRSQAWDTEGEASGSATAQWGLGLEAETWRGEVVLDLEDEGILEAGVEAALECAKGPRRWELSGDCSLHVPEETLEAEARLTLRFAAHQLSVRAWLDSWPLSGDLSSLWRCAGFSLGWKARTVIRR